MELCELLCTISSSDLNELTFENKDIKSLLEFMEENTVTYSLIDEFNNDLSELIDNLIAEVETDEMLEDDYIEEIKADLKEIENEYKDLFNEEVFAQNFKVANKYEVNLVLS